MLPSLFTVTRTAAGNLSTSYVDSLGRVSFVANNVARVEYNPTTLTPKGLLIEESRINYCLQSCNMLNPAWIDIRSTRAASTSVKAPDGVTNATAIKETAVLDTHYILQSISSAFTAGDAMTVSCFFRYLNENNQRYATLAAALPSNNTHTVTVDLLNGNVTQTTSVSDTVYDVNVERFPDNWYRVSFTYNFETGAGSHVVRLYSGPYSIKMGDSSKGIFAWGVQVEKGLFVTSLIKTVTAAISRSVETVSIDGANFSNWFTQADAGSVYAEYTLNVTTNSLIQAKTTQATGVWGISNTVSAGFDGYGVSTYIWRPSGNTGSIRALTRTGGTSVSTSGTANYPTATRGQVIKTVVVWNGNQLSLCVNGVTVPTVTDLNYGSQPLPFDRLEFGSTQTGGNSPNALNGHIRRLKYFNRALTTAEQQEITTL